MRYRRLQIKGGCYFFTIVTYHRQKILTHPHNFQRLRKAFKHVKQSHPFEIDGIVILPDHIHCIMSLPDKDDDFPTKMRLIKDFFSKDCFRDNSGKSIWQPRYWEHLIRNDEDYQRHMDYIHYNPVKHGYVKSPIDWLYGSFKCCVEQGLYPKDWGADEPGSIDALDFE